MGYSMRFYDTDTRPLFVSEIRAGLREIDPQFDIDDANDALGSGYLTHAGALYAEISIDGPDAEYFNYDWSADCLRVSVANEHTAGKHRVEAVLRGAQRMVHVRVRWGGRDAETTLSRLDVLWDWLFTNRSGLLYAEGEGFYEDEELILPLK